MLLYPCIMGIRDQWEYGILVIFNFLLPSRGVLVCTCVKIGEVGVNIILFNSM